MQKFGSERVMYVLANTIQQKGWDGRFHPYNKDWAKTVDIPPNPDSFGFERNCEFVVDSHAGLTDLFVSQARRESLTQKEGAGAVSQPKRKRGVQLNFRVSEEELAAIESKMEQLGIFNREAYLRKMALDGYAVRLDLPELKELLSLLRRHSSNLNQLVRRVNTTGRVYEEDLEDIIKRQSELWEGIGQILTRLAEIS